VWIYFNLQKKKVEGKEQVTKITKNENESSVVKNNFIINNIILLEDNKL